MKKKAVLFLLSFLFFAATAWGKECRSPPFGLATELASYVDNGAVLLELADDIFCFRDIDSLLVPASALKIATSLASFAVLGKEHRFVTTFAVHGKDLYVRGGGDPFLTSEEIDHIAGELKKEGLQHIRDIVLDDSLFALEEPATLGAVDSENPYDAPSGALAVNFNSIAVEVLAGGRVRSAEPQTPTLPVMALAAAGLPQGRHRINVCRGATDREERVLRYAGELLRAMCRRHGIRTGGHLKSGIMPQDADIFYEHRSRQGLDEAVRRLLMHSNNFVANQLFLACGLRRFGAPATWDKARRTVNGALGQQLGDGAVGLELVEGSGLSRLNRVSARAMLNILHAFRPWSHLLPQDREALLKSGTMTGVYCYAGYLQGTTTTDPFVVLLNQTRNTRDQIVVSLLRFWRGVRQLPP